jgi:lactoylglutathione lyase
MKNLLFFACLFFLCTKTGAQMTKPRINHIAFSVLDLQRSVRFYQEVVGLDTIPEPFHDGRHAWFSMGSKSQLHLIQHPPPIIIPTKNTHLCFSVPSIDQFVEKLTKASISFEDWPGKKGAVTIRPDKVKQIYLQDPDGYWLEINDAQ